MNAFPHEQAALEQDLEKAREVLSPEVFEQAWADGLAMTVDDAIAYALENTP